MIAADAPEPTEAPAEHRGASSYWLRQLDARVFGTKPRRSESLSGLLKRTPERLVELVPRFPAAADEPCKARPLLRLARAGEPDALREGLDAGVRAEQAKDRAYRAPP